VSRAFTPRAVESLRPTIQTLTDRLLDGIAARGAAEIVTEFAFPIPVQVVRGMFGVDEAEWDERVVALVRPDSPSAANTTEMMDALADYLTGIVADRVREPGDNIFSAMVVPDDDGERLSDHELLANAVLLLTAGFETTMSLIALGVLTLLCHPDQLRELRADPGLVRNAIEEVLRFEPAALSTTRCALEDVEVGGCVIPAGSNILFPMAAVNRDPARYADPDTFEITRPDIRPMTFGGGAHVCLGAALARLEAEIAIGSFFRKFPDARLAGEPIEWQAQNPTVRRPVALHVHV
jgi:cytochrome P450